MKLEILITLIGLSVAGMAAILGIWMERDKQKPPRYAWALSVLILMATFVGMFQSYQDNKANDKMEADMARMLQMLDKIATTTDVDVPELNEFVKNEVSAQSRANPGVVNKMAQRMADEGEDPTEVLGSYLPASDVEKMQRKGELKIKPPTTKLAPTATAAAAASPSGEPGAEPVDRKSRRRLRLGVGGDKPAADATAAAAVKEAKAAEAKAADSARAAASASAAPSTSASAAAAASASAAPRAGLALPGRGDDKTKPAAAGTAEPAAKPKLGGLKK